MLRPVGWPTKIGSNLVLLSICYILLISQQVDTQQQTNLRSPCPGAFKISTNYQYRNTLHFICLQRRPNSPPRLDVVQYNNRQLVASLPISEMDTSQMASFVDEEGTLRVLVAVPGRLNGTSMYSVDVTGYYLKETHTINTQYVSTMAIWKLELNWAWHLAVANQPHLPAGAVDDKARMSRQPLPDIGPMITIHSWRMSYFDMYQTIQLPFEGHVNKLEPMHINDQEFLIVAMESSRGDNGYHSTHTRSQKTDSMIYKLDFSDGNLRWVLYQHLGTRHAIDVSSFVVTHKNSLQRDYYIAIVGQSEPTIDSRNQPYPSSSQMSDDHGLIIYKYLGDRFIKTHAISAPSVTRIDTLSYGHGDNYVIIALMSSWSKQLSIFLFDGLNLNPAPAPTMPAVRLPAYQRTQQVPGGRYQRTMDSDGFRLFDIPAQIPDVANGTMKRTLDDSAPQSTVMPALVFSIGQGGNMNEYSGQAEPANDILFQLPINEMIAEAEAKLHQSTPSSDNGPSKRNLIRMGPMQDLLGWCKTTIAGILSDRFDSSAQSLATLPRVDQARPIELRGDLVVEGDLHISNLLYANKIEDESARNVPINHMTMDFSSTFDSIGRAHTDIDTIKRRVDQILVDDGSIQEIYAPLKFDRIVFECLNQINVNPHYQHMQFFGSMSCPQVGEVRTVQVNNRDISDIAMQALLTGRSMHISQDVRFEHLILRGRTSILDTLNNIRIEDIVFKQGHSTGPVTGHKNLLSGLYTSANLQVDSWNGARVDNSNFLISSGEQRVAADLRFSRVIIDTNPLTLNRSSRFARLNGLHLDEHLAQIAQADQVNNFELPIAIDELIVQGPTHFGASSRLSSIDMDNTWRNVMFKHLHQNVTAPMDFLGDVHVSYGGDISVGGLINNVSLNPDNVMMRNRNYNLPNPFVFEGDVTASLLQVEEHLNEIQVYRNFETQKNELAILYDGGAQQLSGDKILNDIRLGGRSDISGLINGHLNLTQLYGLVRNNGEPFKFARVRIRGDDIRIADNANLHISSTINGVQANQICTLANGLAQTQRAGGGQYNRLRFEHPVQFNSIRCASINGFNDLQRSFLTKHGQQRVAGTLKLMNGVVFNSTVNVRNTLNNLRVGSMATSINQVINESRTGHKDFYGDFYADELVASSINGLPLSQVFVARADNPQIISAPMIFDHLDIENVLIIGQDLFARTFNGLNITDIVANTLQYDTPQVIYNHIELEHLQILPNANLITRSINGYDLRRVYDDSVLVDLPQQIIAPKTFTGPVDFVDRIFLRFGMDGLTEGELRFMLLLQSDELIEDDLEFDNDLTIMKSLEIQTGIINDVDVNTFVNSVLAKDSQSGLRVRDNSSIRFNDVQVNNLIVTGTIQGLDLNRDALFVDDNRNGTYDSRLREHQINLTNQKILNNLYNNQQQNFPVQTNYHKLPYNGMCQIHSCPQTTPLIPMGSIASAPKPLPVVQRPVTKAQSSQVPLGTWNPQHMPGTERLPSAEPWVSLQQPVVPERFSVQATPLLPRPMNLLMNATQVGPTWRPQTFIRPTRINATAQENFVRFPLIDPKYLEYQALLKAEEISELTLRVNKYLTVSFYYEIVQKHYLLGPVLHATSDPVPSEAESALLMLKSASNLGEPCLKRGQRIDVMAPTRHKGPGAPFLTSSTLQETSNPVHLESLVVSGSHFLFVSDFYPGESSETASQLLVYEWNRGSSLFDLKQRIFIDGWPTVLRSFSVSGLGCITLANPSVTQSNKTGGPVVYCQEAPRSDFRVRSVLPLQGVFDLDITVLPERGQVIIAALSQQGIEQVGDLTLSRFDINTKLLTRLASRRIVKPLKLHILKRSLPDRVRIVVSEGITSNDAAQALTRIFVFDSNSNHLFESQIIHDNQFSDIQSVMLDDSQSLIFLQSAHSISIYAPLKIKTDDYPNDPSCNSRYALMQRLPTKGANKFLVFNMQQPNSIASRKLRDHILVLSREDCDHQKYSTVILAPKYG